MGATASKRKKKKSDKSDFNLTTSDSKLTGKKSFIYLKRFRRNSKCVSNDDEVDKLDTIIQKLWDGDFKAPVEGVLKAGNARVLDVGTGTGTWVMQCAENFPLSNFTGVDFYPVFPSVKNVKLINVTFLRSNILDNLLFDDNTFDFVHMRCLNPIFTEKEWEDQVLKELIRVCKPGGWIELVELDYTYLNQGPTFKKVNEAVRECLMERGVKPILGANYLKQARQLTDVYEEIKNPPYYGSKIGKGFSEHLIRCLQTYRDVLASYMGHSNEEWDGVIETIKKEIVEYKTEGIMKRIYGKKINPVQGSKATA